ncbi:MAG: hypothetical protein IJC59_05960 [Lachnospiraceae bacterium]|nr:hypothetical protein [Lachnospiraceae bacterium]
MKEKLYTIPLLDALAADEECPFCHLERSLEQEALDFVLGSSSSYMESDVRNTTDAAGFCRNHFKKMFEYGNALGNAWILKTHYMKTVKEMTAVVNAAKTQDSTPSGGLFSGKKAATEKDHPVAAWCRLRENSCYICGRVETERERYLDTFFILCLRDPDFWKKVLESKGFCLSHFGMLCEYACLHLKGRQKAALLPPLYDLMEANMARLQEDVNWFIEKFDYRNKDADWKQSRDALQRGMQKLKGGYPADPAYKSS